MGSEHTLTSTLIIQISSGDSQTGFCNWTKVNRPNCTHWISVTGLGFLCVETSTDNPLNSLKTVLPLQNHYQNKKEFNHFILVKPLVEQCDCLLGIVFIRLYKQRFKLSNMMLTVAEPTASLL